MLHLAWDQALRLKFCRVRNTEKNTVLPSAFQKAKSLVHSSSKFPNQVISTYLQIRELILKDCPAYLSTFSKIWRPSVCNHSPWVPPCPGGRGSPAWCSVRMSVLPCVISPLCMVVTRHMPVIISHAVPKAFLHPNWNLSIVLARVVASALCLFIAVILHHTFNAITIRATRGINHSNIYDRFFSVSFFTFFHLTWKAIFFFQLLLVLPIVLPGNICCS